MTVYFCALHCYTARTIISYTHFDYIFVVIKKQLCLILWHNAITGLMTILFCNVQDDLRKDARLMEFNTLVNKVIVIMKI